MEKYDLVVNKDRDELMGAQRAGWIVTYSDDYLCLRSEWDPGDMRWITDRSERIITWIVARFGGMRAQISRNAISVACRRSAGSIQAGAGYAAAESVSKASEDVWAGGTRCH